MATWSVSPDDGNFSINGNEVTFYPNTSGVDRHYVVTGTEDGCTCSRDMTVLAGAPAPEDNPCLYVTTDSSVIRIDKNRHTGSSECDSVYFYKGNVGWEYNPPTASTWLSVSVHWQGDSDWSTYACSDYQSNPYVAYRLQDQLSLPHNENDPNLGSVNYEVTENTGPERRCTVTYTIDGESCGKVITVIQEGEGEPPTPPEPPETGSCSQLDVAMDLKCNASTRKHYIEYEVNNWYSDCSSMIFLSQLRYTNSEGQETTTSFGDVTFTGNGIYTSLEYSINPQDVALIGVATCWWYGDSSVRFNNTVLVSTCGEPPTPTTTTYSVYWANQTNYTLENVQCSVTCADGTTFTMPPVTMSSNDSASTSRTTDSHGGISSVNWVSCYVQGQDRRLSSSSYTAYGLGNSDITIHITSTA